MSDDENSSGASTQPSPTLGSRGPSIAPSLAHPSQGSPPATPSPKGSPSPSTTPAPRESESAEDLYQDPGIASRKRDKGKQRAVVPRDPPVVAASASAVLSVERPPPTQTTGGEDKQVHDRSTQSSRHSIRTSETTYSHVMPASATIERGGKATEGVPRPPPTRRHSDTYRADSGPRRPVRETSTVSVAEVASTMKTVPPKSFFGKQPSRVPASAPAVVPTPFKESSGTAGAVTIEKQRDILDAELKKSWVFGGLRFFSNLLLCRPDIPTRPTVGAFLSQYAGFDSATRMWRDLPRLATSENDRIYNPLVVHFNKILEHFGYATRQAVKTAHRAMSHEAESQGGRKNTTMPDISVLGWGPRMGERQEIRKKYSHCVAVIEVKTEEIMKKNLKKHQLQLASYAREIFVQQPTRRFVYGLLVSEQTIQLYQFDRGGVIYSSKYDIRDDAETFVQIFLAVATEDEIALGLGKHIFWAPDGKCYFDPKGKMNRVYAVVTSEKPFRRAAIRGRCTTCWRVEDDQKNQFLLKFAWRAMGRVKESVFLKAVKEANLQHVGLMERSRTIETLYCVRSYMPLIAVNGRGERFPVPDRAHHWLLEPWYGPTLDQFESPLELLEGFYDAITASRELLSIGILHRDISISNIVFDRRPDADTFAKLIDMDMAIRLDRTKSGVKTDVRTGTRAFQSLKVLSGIGQHDHLDELEFLFWVFCYIVFSYDAPGKLKKKPETCLQGFQSSKPAQAIDAKKLVLWNAELPRKVSIGLGAGTPALFRKLQLFFLKVTEDTRKKIDSRGYKATNDIYEEIMGAAGLSTAQGPELVLPSVSDEDTNVWLKKEALQHYQLVLNLVRESIDLTRRYMDGALLWKQVGADDENMEGETRVEEPNLDDHSDEGFSDASDVVGEASWEGEAGYTVPAAGVTSHSSGYSNKRSASQSFDVEDDVSMEPSTSRATKRAKGSHSRRK